MPGASLTDVTPITAHSGVPGRIGGSAPMTGSRSVVIAASVAGSGRAGRRAEGRCGDAERRPAGSFTAWGPDAEELSAAGAVNLVTGIGRLLRLARGMAERDLRVQTVDAGCAGVGPGFHGGRVQYRARRRRRSSQRRPTIGGRQAQS